MQRFRNRLALGLALVVVLLAGAAAWRLISRDPGITPSPGPVPHAFYIWQRQWAPEVLDAVDTAAPHTAGFMVLVSEAQVRDDTVIAARAYPRWETLAETELPVTLVIRAGISLAAHIAEPAGRAAAADYLSALAEHHVAEASAAGVNVAGIQLDYDCPTSRLAHYAQLLDELALDRPRLALSITTLPTWLESPDFRRVVKGLDYYVLQVHSLEKPAAIDDGTALCRTERIPGYLARANALPTPFYLALPTYGYELAFDGSGAFLGLAAEGPRPDWGTGTQTRVIMADPAALAKVVRDTESAPPARLCGIVWFRLPVETDRLNWHWNTMRAVMEGRAPEVSLTSEIRRPRDGLFEVWIRNIGESSPAEPVEVRIACDRSGIQARDLLNGFAETGISATGFHLFGPAPPPGDEILAGWYRFRGAGPTAGSVSVRTEGAS